MSLKWHQEKASDCFTNGLQSTKNMCKKPSIRAAQNIGPKHISVGKRGWVNADEGGRGGRPFVSEL